jgi:hypothetical protein
MPETTTARELYARMREREETMSYAERVEANLKGLTAVSTGTCPGCDECRESVEYIPEHTYAYGDGKSGDGRWYIKAVGVGASYDTEEECLAGCREAFEAGWSAGCFDSEPSFSWSPCGICDSHRGGDREVWHGRDDLTGTLYHFDDACTDCVIYLANGDLPEEDE